MGPEPLPATIRSLATAEPGDDLLVRAIFFDAVRQCCASHAVREGERIHCRGAGSSHLTVRTQAGRTVTVSRACAEYVHVERVGRIA